MIGTKRYPPSRGKQPAAVPEEETHEQEATVALDPSTPTPDPQRPVESVEDDEEDAGDESSLRDRLHKTPTKERFIELAQEYRKLKSKIQELQDENDVLQAEKHETDIMIEHLQVERDEAMLIVILLFNQTGAGAPIVEAAVIRKSTKMPDAPMLNDGKEVRFETWETVIRQKLEANADHYPLPVHRKLYVQSRCEGKAQLHIAPRMSTDASTPYEDAEDIILHLKTVFANPNRRAEAYTAYHRLKMKPKDNSTDFLAEFMQLAEEAAVVIENRKRDLYSKLPYLLQTQVMWAVNQEAVSFDAFTQSCQSMSHGISLQQEAKSTSSRSRAGNTGSGAGASVSTTTGSSYVPRIKFELC
ncbi:hypothetical protein VN97_g13036 [Penicillium thymicola]|uniref:Uncharacterized protein n=1 Tax=Penicillium thymicola TaxID=293382 RepID=A0AAI9X1R5_PENTH|nr:hypothetical protein VN97_g13036 [Penicillium thymicola]